MTTRHSLLSHDIDLIMLRLEIAIEAKNLSGPFREAFRDELKEIQVTSPY